MASPITWRNVGTTANSSGVGSLLESARRSANSGFAAVQGVFDKAEQTADANREVIKGNNTADFIRQLNSYGSAEEYQAALESGALDQQLDSYGRMVDPAVAAQMFSQGDKYRDRDTSRNQFADDQTLRGQRGLEDQIQKLTAAGKFDEAKPLIDQLQMNSGEFAQDVRQAEVADKKLGWEEGRYQLAQAAGARAQQSHQMQMQQAREAAEERRRTQAAGSMVMDYFNTYKQQTDAYEAGTASVMKDLGLSGNFTNLADEDKKRVTAEMGKRDLVAPPTQTEMLQTVTSQLANSPETTPATMVAVTSQLDQLMNGSNAIASSDQAKIEAKKASVAAQVAEAQSSNPYFSADPASKQAEEVMDVVRNTYDSWTVLGSNQEDVQEMVTDLTTKGYDTTLSLKMPDGSTKTEKVNIKLTAPAFKEALTLTDASDGFNVRDDVEDWIEQNKVALFEANLASKSAQDGLESVRRFEQELRSRKYGDVEVTDDTMTGIRDLTR